MTDIEMSPPPVEWTPDTLKEVMDMRATEFARQLAEIRAEVGRNRDQIITKLAVADYQREHNEVRQGLAELKARVDVQEGQHDQAKDSWARVFALVAAATAIVTAIVLVVQLVH